MQSNIICKQRITEICQQKGKKLTSDNSTVLETSTRKYYYWVHLHWKIQTRDSRSASSLATYPESVPWKRTIAFKKSQQYIEEDNGDLQCPPSLEEGAQGRRPARRWGRFDQRWGRRRVGGGRQLVGGVGGGGACKVRERRAVAGLGKRLACTFPNMPFAVQWNK